MKPGYAIVQKKIDAIEAEMKRIGYWQSEPLDPGQYGFQRAFAMDTMTFSQWLQFIFIPRVKEIVAIAGEFPRRSMVGAQAVREFDGAPEASDLVGLLSEFDALFK
jgi:uncharacterized protein YqcC (DUF446 family)